MYTMDRSVCHTGSSVLLLIDSTSGKLLGISAIVADNPAHPIELVQLTPNGDKGPVVPPQMVLLD